MIADPPITVLIVDDEKEVCKMYQAHFEDQGYRTRVATGGAEALVKTDDDVDVVLLDRRMPEMPGDEVLEFIRDWNIDCRVVMVTAVEPDETIVEMEFDGYLTKPVSRDRLSKTVKRQVLFDQYQTLFERYQTATNKHALLKTESDIDSEKLKQLAERREKLETKLQQTVEAFDHEEITQTLADLHQHS